MPNVRRAHNQTREERRQELLDELALLDREIEEAAFPEERLQRRMDLGHDAHVAAVDRWRGKSPEELDALDADQYYRENGYTRG